MDLFGKKRRDFDRWLTSASLDELRAAYETRRKEWARTGFGGNGLKTPEMEKINAQISVILKKLWENSPVRNRDPNFRWTDANRWDKD